MEDSKQHKEDLRSVWAGGVRMKIQNVKELRDFYEDELMSKLKDIKRNENKGYDSDEPI